MARTNKKIKVKRQKAKVKEITTKALGHKVFSRNALLRVTCHFPHHPITSSLHHLFCLFCLFTFTFCLPLASCKKEKTYPIWLWTGGIKDTSVHYLDSSFQVLSDAGISEMLVHAGRKKLEKIIPIADKYNIEIHAWVCTMNRGDADTSWLSVNHLGKSLAEEKAYVGYYKFMCPALQNDNDLQKAIKAAMDGEADGVTLFSFGSLNEYMLKQLKSQ